MIYKSLSAAVLIVLGLTSTNAAAAEPTHWAGCYAGLTAGGVVQGRSYKTNSVSFGGNIFPAQTNNTPISGPVEGIDAGCNIQLPAGSGFAHFIIGPELEGWLQHVSGMSDVANARSPGETIRAFAKSTKAAAASLRIGYAMDKVLFYGKAGAAVTTFEHNGNIFDNVSGAIVDITSNTNSTAVGYLLGVGAEYSIGRHWSIKGEYNYVDFGNVDTTYQISLDPGLPTAAILKGPSRSHENENALKVGFAYHF